MRSDRLHGVALGLVAQHLRRWATQAAATESAQDVRAQFSEATWVIDRLLRA
jgi:hypothetical protein